MPSLSPSFNRRKDVPIIESFSEPEINEWENEELILKQQKQLINNRPTSVTFGNFNNNNIKNKQFLQQKRKIIIEGGGHTSDSSTCSVGGPTPIYFTKSGSSTPREEIVEQQQEETRRKVGKIENKLFSQNRKPRLSIQTIYPPGGLF